MVKPKKHLGQHFLTDQNIALKIVDSLDDSSENILEIGPGTGILTDIILEKNPSHFKVIEIDRESVIYLKKNYPKLDIHEGDFLRFPLDTLFENQFSIIGNFPYNISTQILFKILDHRNLVKEMVGMFQKEVADRVMSPPGNKTYGILSVLIQAYYDLDYLFTVSPGVFHPPPKVNSAVIRLKRNNILQHECNEKLFFALVKKGFNQRRKTLRNSLKPFTFDDNSKVTELLTKRAETLNYKDFIFLTTQAIV